MRKISKGLAIVAAAAAIGGAGIAVAQTGGPGFGPGYGMMGFGGPSVYGPMHSGQGPGGYGMMGGWGGGPMFADPTARLDALKTKLAIRPDQQAAWNTYVQAVEDSAKQMQALRGSMDFDALRTMDWQQHQAFMARMFDQRAAAFRTVDSAGTKLMAALDDSQKARLLSPGLGYGGAAGGYGGAPCPGFAFGMMGSGPGGGR